MKIYIDMIFFAATGLCRFSLVLIPLSLVFVLLITCGHVGAVEKSAQITAEQGVVSGSTSEKEKDTMAPHDHAVDKDGQIHASSENLRLGERMYREGLLSSGEPMQAIIKGDTPITGSIFSCVSCHLRSGLGSVEGGVFTPPTTGDKLFQPLHKPYKKYGVGQKPEFFPLPRTRPAYTDESLAEVLRDGVDPSGRTLDDIMPRYLLGKADMEIMIAYLKSLSAQSSAGVSGSSIRFATILTDEVRQEDRDAMLAPLVTFVNTKNRHALLLKKVAGSGYGVMGGDMMNSLRQFVSLSIWQLHGAPETWREQLEEYNRKEPAFALLGGVTYGDWQPIHQFSEENHIPCLFPATDYPVISATDWYTVYLSKGYYQEGEGAARYLNKMAETVKGRPIVQIVRDSREGKALSKGFSETWLELGHEAPLSVTLKVGQEISADVVKQLAANGKPAAIILWDGPSALTSLDILTTGGNKPEMIFVSSSYLGKSMWDLKETVRDTTYITYPFRLDQLPQGGAKQANQASGKWIFSTETSKAANHAFSIIEVLPMAIMDMKGSYYRDNFLDALAMIEDIEVPLYERVSFGPGQRYVSKGCYIVQLSKGTKPELRKLSDWVNR